MRFGSRRTILCATGIFVGCLVTTGLIAGQGAQEPKPQMAEEVFKNVTVLKGIPVDEFMSTMGMFAAAVSLNCIDCHVPESVQSLAKFADDTPIKQTARRMVLMVNTLNKTNFGGRTVVTCWTCHRGEVGPAKGVPNLTVQYSAPPEDANEVEVIRQAPNAPTPDQVFAKYIQAAGGAQRVNALTSITGKGQYAGWDTDFQKVDVEIYAKAPTQRTTVVHMNIEGKVEDSVRTFDGRMGWVASPDKPLPLMPLTGGNLDAAKTEAILFFPAAIQKSFMGWKTGAATIDDDDVVLVQGVTPANTPIKLYFSEESGLLKRALYYANTVIGRVPTQIDVEEYKDVSGMKIPSKWTSTWTDGQAHFDLSQVQANVAVDAAKFNKPAPAPVHN
jgi:Photosynthetic reaction centre cytochrome C subunit